TDRFCDLKRPTTRTSKTVTSDSCWRAQPETRFEFQPGPTATISCSPKMTSIVFCCVDPGKTRESRKAVTTLASKEKLSRSSGQVCRWFGLHGDRCFSQFSNYQALRIVPSES